MFKKKIEGGAVAEWSKVLLWREKINENQKIPGLPPGLGTFYKKTNIKFGGLRQKF
jgi:hypothetical protein